MSGVEAEVGIPKAAAPAAKAGRRASKQEDAKEVAAAPPGAAASDGAPAPSANPILYGMSISSNCVCVKVVAQVIGLAVDWKEIDLMKVEQKTPEYLAKFPMGQVPGLEHKVEGTDACLMESTTIIRYLCNLARDKADETGMYPKNLVAMCTVEQMLDVRGWLYRHISLATYTSIGFGPPMSDEEQKTATATLLAELAKLEWALADPDAFLCGLKKPSAADVVLAGALLYTKGGIAFEMPPKWANWMTKFRATDAGKIFTECYAPLEGYVASCAAAAPAPAAAAAPAAAPDPAAKTKA